MAAGAVERQPRGVFIHLTNGVPDYEYRTVGTSATGIVVNRVRPFAEHQKLYPTPCACLTEKTI